MPMISAEELAQAAEAARMEIPAAELDGFLEAVNALFAFVKEQWATLDVEGVAPTAYVRPLKNVTRPDEPRPSLPLETALANAPEEENGCFRVPRIIEE